MSIALHGLVYRGDLRLQIDLDIGSGPTAVVGPNGAGKTTLLRTVAGLEALDSGELTIGRTATDDPDGHQRFIPAHERGVAMCFQEPRLIDHRTALDNVALGARRSHAVRDARRLAHQTIEMVGGIEPSARATDLSGGQRQRVALARALVVPTRVLLLDEPLASVDDESRAELRRLITTITDRPVLWVTHDPADAVGLPTIAVDSGEARLVGQTERS